MNIDKLLILILYVKANNAVYPAQLNEIKYGVLRLRSFEAYCKATVIKTLLH